MGQIAKYGQVQGPETNIEYEVGASVVFKHLGGAFVQMDANQRVIIAVAGVTDIMGWALTGDFTASATAGNTKVAVNTAVDAVYEMPLDAARTETQLKALVGKTCDIKVTSDIQYADYAASTDDVLHIVGYRYYGSASGEQTLLVKRYAKNLVFAGVV